MPIARLLLVISLLATTELRADFRAFTAIGSDPSLETRVRRAAEASLRDFPNLEPADLAISVVDLTNPALPARAGYQGGAPFYPASVIKLFHMADIYMQNKESVGDVDRALKEMIVVSDNDATAYLVDILAGTTGVTQLEGRALRKFIDQRRQINRHFERLGYDISAMMKPWSFGPFGRELQLLGKNRENRNRLSADATASLLLWIVRRRVRMAEEMMSLLERPLSPQRKDENQVKENIGEALPEGARLWSKSGWTSEVRHDAAYVELPSGRKLILVIFTRSADTTLIPAVTRQLLRELEQ